jgi:hypothetical protein
MKKCYNKQVYINIEFYASWTNGITMSVNKPLNGSNKFSLLIPNF